MRKTIFKIFLSILFNFLPSSMMMGSLLIFLPVVYAYNFLPKTTHIHFTYILSIFCFCMFMPACEMKNNTKIALFQLNKEVPAFKLLCCTASAAMNLKFMKKIPYAFFHHHHHPLILNFEHEQPMSSKNGTMRNGILLNI